MDSVIWWVRRDMRLSDNAALLAALAHGLPVVPVFILDPQTEALGAAPRWRLGQAIAALDAALRAKGSRLILRRGQALTVLASALGPLLLAWCVDWTGSYQSIFFLLAAVIGLVAGSSLAVRLPQPGQ